MFGYIKTFKPELKIREFTTYKAFYCGLCYNLGKSFGPVARLTLSYDFTFLSMLFASVSDEEAIFEECRCCVNPFKKVHMCKNGVSQAFSANVAAIMIYYRLLDNIQDSGFFKKLGWYMLLPYAGHAYKKAASALPEASSFAKEMMERQKEVEIKKSPSIDEACEPSAAAMAGILALLSDKPGEKRVLERLGYLMGRYVYMCDAIDDFEDDKKSGNYNPLVIKYLQDSNKNSEDFFAAAKQSLYMTVGEIAKTCDLLDKSRYESIISNIIHLGLRAQADEIISSKTCNLAKNKLT